MPDSKQDHENINITMHIPSSPLHFHLRFPLHFTTPTFFFTLRGPLLYAKAIIPMPRHANPTNPALQPSSPLLLPTALLCVPAVTLALVMAAAVVWPPTTVTTFVNVLGAAAPLALLVTRTTEGVTEVEVEEEDVVLSVREEE
jgi:hypothetical protein